MEYRHKEYGLGFKFDPDREPAAASIGMSWLYYLARLWRVANNAAFAAQVKACAKKWPDERYVVWVTARVVSGHNHNPNGYCARCPDAV